MIQLATNYFNYNITVFTSFCINFQPEVTIHAALLK